MLDLNEINNIILDIGNWIDMHVFSIKNLIDGVFLIFIYFLAIYSYKNIFSDINKLLKKIKFINVHQKNNLVNIILKPLIYILFLWIYILITQITGLSHFFSSIVANLFTAWVFIKLITTFLPKKFYVKIISLFIWSITALKILNIYDQTLKILDNIAFKSGNLQISLLLVFKGIILFTIFFWSANKINDILTKRIEKTDNLTPSIKVLVKKMSKFVFYTIAFLITLSSIGIDLSAFAFLGGAVGVGLGFGLQKIVSNFISGIIILLDKSIKPGDVVEINDIYGRVKSLDTRFVSVVTLSGKEYLVPNENFITNRVINWSYSDELVRIDVPVGVSYNSDLNLVYDLLLKAVKDKKRVVNKPSPSCILKEFGDSTVNFELRFWIRDPQYGLANIKSDVLFSIWNLLKENNITIAFPQHDLHFESVSDEMLNNLKELFNSQKNNNEVERNDNETERNNKKSNNEAAASEEDRE